MPYIERCGGTFTSNGRARRPTCLNSVRLSILQAEEDEPDLCDLGYLQCFLEHRFHRPGSRDVAQPQDIYEFLFRLLPYGVGKDGTANR